MPTITLKLDEKSYPQMKAALLAHYGYQPILLGPEGESTGVANKQTPDEFVVAQLNAFMQAHLNAYLHEQGVERAVAEKEPLAIKQKATVDLTAVDDSVFAVAIAEPLEELHG